MHSNLLVALSKSGTAMVAMAVHYTYYMHIATLNALQPTLMNG